MKFLSVILFFIGSLSFGQTVQIETLQLNKSDDLSECETKIMNFPIISSGNKKIDSLINADLINRFTGNKNQNDIFDSTLRKWIEENYEFIEYIEYVVTYNENDVISLNITTEGCGAYCITTTKYFNYSTFDGKWLLISDILNMEKELETRIFNDKEKQYKEQKNQLKESFKNQNSGLKKTTYDWALKYYENCESSFEINTFSIHNDRIEFIENCYLPNAIKSLSPYIILEYKFSDIEEYLKITEFTLSR